KRFRIIINMIAVGIKQHLYQRIPLIDIMRFLVRDIFNDETIWMDGFFKFFNTFFKIQSFSVSEVDTENAAADFCTSDDSGIYRLIPRVIVGMVHAEFSAVSVIREP